MVALPAVLLLSNITPPLGKMLLMVALPPLIMIPAPLNVRVLSFEKVKSDAPALKVKPPTVVFVENDRLVVPDIPNDAVPAGTWVGFQLVAVSKSFVPGLARHVASCARAAVPDNVTRTAIAPMACLAARGSRKLLCRPRLVPNIDKRPLRIWRASDTQAHASFRRGWTKQ